MALRRPEFLLLLLLLCALANYGFPLGVARIRLTEICVGLMCAAYMARARAGMEPPVWRRLPPAFWLAGGGYLIAALVAAGADAMGDLRFEIEAALVLLFALRWGPRLTQVGRDGVQSFTTGVSCATLLACSAALILAACGVRAVWFFAADAPFTIIPFGEGGVATSGMLQLGGTFGHKSYLAAFLLLTLPVVLSALLEERSSRAARRLALCAGIVGLATLTLTGALIGVVCTVAALWLAASAIVGRAAKRERATAWRSRRIWFPGAIVFAVLVAGLFSSGRLSALASQGGSGPLKARVYLWHEGWHLVESHPLTGIGREGFERFVDGGFPHAHNLYLMKCIESGLVGGTLFACLIVICVAAAVRSMAGARFDSVLHIGLSAGSLGFCVYSMGDYFYNEPPLMALFWMWGGLAIGARRVDSQSVETESACPIDPM